MQGIFLERSGRRALLRCCAVLETLIIIITDRQTERGGARRAKYEASAQLTAVQNRQKNLQMRISYFNFQWRNLHSPFFHNVNFKKKKTDFVTETRISRATIVLKAFSFRIPNSIVIYSLLTHFFNNLFQIETKKRE